MKSENRIFVSLDATTYKAIKALSVATATSMSAVVREYMEFCQKDMQTRAKEIEQANWKVRDWHQPGLKYSNKAGKIRHPHFDPAETEGPVDPANMYKSPKDNE